MILPVNILNFSQTPNIQKNNYFTSINRTKQRNTNTDSKISFGSIHHLKEYNWLNAFDDFIQKNNEIKENTLEIAFEKLYKSLQINLLQKGTHERAKAELHEQNIAAGLKSHGGREFFINEAIPVKKERFIEVSSSFAKKIGLNHDLPVPEVAIKDFVLNDLKIPEFKQFTKRLPDFLKTFFTTKEYTVYTDIFTKVYALMQKELIVVKSAKY